MSQHDHALVDEIEAIVEAVALDAERLASRRRRLLRALWDLGLLDIVGRDWVRLGDGFTFADLDPAAADRFTSALEDLAGSGRVTRPTQCAGQLALDFNGGVGSLTDPPASGTEVVR